VFELPSHCLLGAALKLSAGTDAKVNVNASKKVAQVHTSLHSL
jgi:hypothetical protein